MTTSTFRYGIVTQRIQILSVEYIESMIDFTLSQTAKDRAVWQALYPERKDGVLGSYLTFFFV